MHSACKRVAWLLAIGGSLLPGVVRAQGVFNMGSLTNTLAIPTGKPGGKRPAKAQAVLRYKPAAALEAQTVRAYVARTKPTAPAAAQAVASTFGPGKASYAQVYQSILAGSGFQDHDVASALGLYLELGYRVVRNIQDDKVVTPSQERGLRAQVAQLLNQTGRPTTAAAAARLGEELKLQTVVLTLGWKQAVQRGELTAFRNATASQFSTSYHFDFQHVQLTDAGFVASN